MIDRIFLAALTFCFLIGGTLAIGSAFFGIEARRAASASEIVKAPAPAGDRVVVVGKRIVPVAKSARAS